MKRARRRQFVIQDLFSFTDEKILKIFFRSVLHILCFPGIYNKSKFHEIGYLLEQKMSFFPHNNFKISDLWSFWDIFGENYNFWCEIVIFEDHSGHIFYPSTNRWFLFKIIQNIPFLWSFLVQNRRFCAKNAFYGLILMNIFWDFLTYFRTDFGSF